MSDIIRALNDLVVYRDIVYVDGCIPTRDKLVEILEGPIDALHTALEVCGAAQRLRNAQISYMSVRNAEREIREPAGQLVALAAEELDTVLAKARGDLAEVVGGRK